MGTDGETLVRHMALIGEISDKGSQQRPSSSAVTALVYSLHNRYTQAEGEVPDREDLIREATIAVLGRAGIHIGTEDQAPIVVDRLL